MLRVEQEAAAATQRAEERARASSSGRWGSEELEAFTGLRWVKQDTGVHRFTHAATGFSFQLSAADPEQFDDDDDAEAAERKRRESDVMSGAGAPADEVSFEPIEFGAADGTCPDTSARPSSSNAARCPSSSVACWVFSTRWRRSTWRRGSRRARRSETTRRNLPLPVDRIRATTSADRLRLPE